MKKFLFICIISLFVFSSASSYNRWDYYDDENEQEMQEVYIDTLFSDYFECVKYNTEADCKGYDPAYHWDNKIKTAITWKCVDVTSYDGNAYNDNKCTSNKGQVLFVSDSTARGLDRFYRPGKSGAWFYNSK